MRAKPSKIRNFIEKSNIDQHARNHQCWLYMADLGQILAIVLGLASAVLVVHVELRDKVMSYNLI